MAGLPACFPRPFQRKYTTRPNDLEMIWKPSSIYTQKELYIVIILGPGPTVGVVDGTPYHLFIFGALRMGPALGCPGLHVLRSPTSSALQVWGSVTRLCTNEVVVHEPAVPRPAPFTAVRQNRSGLVNKTPNPSKGFGSEASGSFPPPKRIRVQGHVWVDPMPLPLSSKILSNPAMPCR